jgi:2-methylisocitrate lyase-like PEP mutase family enzyme
VTHRPKFEECDLGNLKFSFYGRRPMRVDQQKRQKLRDLLNSPGIIVAPGAFDAISGCIVEQAGFNAIFFSGGALSRSNGFPEIGLVTMTEVLDRVGRVIASSSIPVIVDADTGYGNSINAIRTVQELERIGAASFLFEDQVTPKRGGHWAGKQVIAKEDMVKKLRAAYEVREDPNMMIIARCDAIAVEGFDSAIDRARAYRDAGADILFVEAPTSVIELEAIPKLLEGTPCLVNRVPLGGKTPPMSATELETMGYKIAIFPTDAQLAAIYAMKGVLKQLRSTGTTDGYPMIPMPERDQIIGWSKYKKWEEQYL